MKIVPSSLFCVLVCVSACLSSVLICVLICDFSVKSFPYHCLYALFFHALSLSLTLKSTSPPPTTTKSCVNSSVLYKFSDGLIHFGINFSSTNRTHAHTSFCISRSYKLAFRFTLNKQAPHLSRSF